MSYLIIQKYIQKNRPYTQLNAKGAVIHETANPGDSDELNQKYFANSDVNASAHAFIDSDSITQCIPWNEISWHGGKTANKQFWGIELCHTTDPNKFLEIWKRGIWLYAHLFTKVAIPPIHMVTKDNLMSHAEVSEKWKETDHMDPVSYFAKFGKTVDDFRSDVQEEINKMLGKNKSHWAQEHLDYLKSEDIEIYETRFEDYIKRGELFALLVQLIKFIKKILYKK
jgi:N-acetylmuramoyl-L-alanine amidase CwlA